MIRISGLLVCLLLVISGAGMAQNRDTATAKKVRFTPEQRADKMSDKLDRRLNLTKQQDLDIHTINTDITRRMEELKHNTALSKKDKMQQMKALNEERNQRFKSVLTPDQYKKWNDWEMKKKEQMEARMDKKQQKRNAR
jgi:Spy/CpxP family protein refolding chaperone